MSTNEALFVLAKLVVSIVKKVSLVEVELYILSPWWAWRRVCQPAQDIMGRMTFRHLQGPVLLFHKNCSMDV